MSSAAVTLKCGACGKLLTVGAEMHGLAVRCPHCQQVAQAPAMEAAAVPPSLPEAALPPADEEPVPIILPADTDHILTASEIPQDELFSDGTPTVEMPPPEPMPHGPTLPPTEPAPSDVTTLQEGPKQEPLPNGGDRWHAPTLVHSPTRLAAASPEPASGAAPWSEEQTLVLGAPAALASPPEPATRATPRRRAKLPFYFWLLALLLPFTLLLIPIYLKVRRGMQEKAIHPLESVQDDGVYKEFQEGKRLPEAWSPMGDLAKDLAPLKLRQVGRFGGLEVQPLEISRQKLPYSFYRGTTGYVTSDEHLVLRLRLKNVSDIIFHPHDPLFNRAYSEKVSPYAYLTIGTRNYYGSVTDPITERVKGQNFGELLPGEAMETIFIAAHDTASGLASEELKKARADQPLIWRVHLRKGREPIRGRQVWVTTVIPIQFQPAEVMEGKQEVSETPKEAAGEQP